MHEPQTPTSGPSALASAVSRLRVSTPGLAFIGVTWFVSGLFVLSSAGRAFPWETYALMLAGAVIAAVPLLLITLAVAASEAVLGRAWANGLRRLDGTARAVRPTAARGVRYAGVLWLANGAALWLATVASQF